MPSAQLIVWPFHGGLPDVSMGAGASRLAADREFRAELAAGGTAPEPVWVEPVSETLPELARIFELDRRLARQVGQARRRGALPVVLAGDCISCLGTTAGVRTGEPLGVVWLDAHADFDTPEDNLSGFPDVMGLAVLTGSGWRALRETIPGFAAIDESDVALVGTRDLEAYQRDRVAASRLSAVTGTVDPPQLRSALDAIRRRVKRVYLHVDLDVLDTSVGRANVYAAAGGPDLDTVLGAVVETFARFEVAAVALTAYDPSADTDGAIAGAARAIAREIAQHLTPDGRP
jgi:arginase